jgi:hypothetical protein
VQVAKTFEALKRYYTEKGQLPSASFKKRNEEDRGSRSEYSSTAETQDITEPNTANEAGTTSRQKEGDPYRRKDRVPTRSKPFDKTDPIAGSHIKATYLPKAIAHKESYTKPIVYFRIYKIEKQVAKKILLNLRQNVVRDIVEFKYFLKIRDYLKYVHGELIKSKEGIYYKIGLESKVSQSILFDRRGNFINFIISQNQCESRKVKTSVERHLMDSEAISRFQRNCINNLYKHIDFKTFNKLFKDVFRLSLSGDIICRDGRIAVIDNQVVYEIAFRSTVRFFLLMDHRGNYLNTTSYNDTMAWDILVEEIRDSKNILPPFSLLKNWRLLPD